MKYEAEDKSRRGGGKERVGGERTGINIRKNVNISVPKSLSHKVAGRNKIHS